MTALRARPLRSKPLFGIQHSAVMDQIRQLETELATDLAKRMECVRLAGAFERS